MGVSVFSGLGLTPTSTIAARKCLLTCLVREWGAGGPQLAELPTRRALGPSQARKGDEGEPLTKVRWRKGLAHSENEVGAVCFFLIFSEA